MNATMTADPPDVGTLAWEGDRRSIHDLDDDMLRLLEGAVEFLWRTWPRQDEDPDREQDAIDAIAFGVLTKELEDFDLDPDEPIGPQIEGLLKKTRDEGVKDATVPSRANTAERKAMRLLIERRLEILTLRRDDGFIHAQCRGDSGAVYDLGYDPRRRQYRCTCQELRGHCSHLLALKMVTTTRGTS
jgi:hypothetical protein